MGLSSFTNEVGNHSRNEVRTARQRGYYYGGQVDEIIASYGTTVEHSRKPLPTMSDGKRPTNYTRSVSKVTADVPAKYRRLIREGNSQNNYVTVDLIGERYISQDVEFNTRRIGNQETLNDAVNQSVNAALNNLPSASAGTASNIAQAKQTVDEFSKLGSKFARVFRALQRKDLKLAWDLLGGLTKENPSDIPKTLGELWLMYIYGVKPLMNDLYEMNQAVNGYLGEPLYVSAKGSGVHQEQSKGEERDFYIQGTCKQSARTEISALVVNPAARALNSLGLANPLSTAWDLLPWSFALDWFIPIGQTLSAVTATVGLEPNGGTTTVQQYRTWEQRRKTTFEGYGFGWTDGGFYQEADFSFERICFVNFPLPRLASAKNPFSTTHGINALALVTQLTK